MSDDALLGWEKMMACCFPWGFVWLKEGGPGKECFIACLLGMCCCANVCYACKYVGKPGSPGSPYEQITTKTVITMQPR